MDLSEKHQTQSKYETLARLIDPILKELADYDDADLIESMLSTVLKLPKEDVSRGDMKILNAAIKEIRYGYKVFSKYKAAPKVTFFGSARTPETSPEYVHAVALAKKLAALGWMVITGAGDGIMKAGHQGAGSDNSFGLNIRLPFEQSANDVIAADEKLINFKYFFTRKLFFLKESEGIIMFPGGFGTFDEAFESLTLIQTGKTSPIPVVFVDRPGGYYWSSLAGYMNDHMLGNRLISPDDLSLFLITSDLDKAIDHIVSFYRIYDSSRYVHDALIIRLKKEIGDGDLAQLNVDFKSILSSGAIERCAMHEDEWEEPHTAHMPRLRLHFNRHNFGRLQQFIYALNKLG